MNFLLQVFYCPFSDLAERKRGYAYDIVYLSPLIVS